MLTKRKGYQPQGDVRDFAYPEAWFPILSNKVLHIGLCSDFICISQDAKWKLTWKFGTYLLLKQHLQILLLKQFHHQFWIKSG